MAKLTDLDVMQRSRRLFVGAIMLVIGGVIGYALPKHSATPSTQTGMTSSVTIGARGAATTFTLTPASGSPQHYKLAEPTWWQAPSGQWRDVGLPPCLVPGKSAKVTVGIVGVTTYSSVPGGALIAWITCDG